MLDYHNDNSNTNFYKHMKKAKQYLLGGSSFLLLLFSSRIFNHISPWVGISAFILGVYLLIKFFKEKKS